MECVMNWNDMFDADHSPTDEDIREYIDIA